MNTLPHEVTKVLGKPYYKKWNNECPGYWFVKVEYNCYGRLDTTELFFKSEEEALAVDIGYRWEG